MYGVSGIPCNGRRDTTENVLGSSSKWPFIVDQSQAKVRVL